VIEAALVCRNGVLVPHSPEDARRLADIEPDVVLRAKITAPRKQRSYQQLKLWWACCRTVADNTDDPNWNTPEKVSEQIKLALRFIRSYMVAPDGTVHIVTRSVSFGELGHMEACNFFDQSWPIMAEKIGVSVDDLLAETYENVRMKSLIEETT